MKRISSASGYAVALLMGVALGVLGPTAMSRLREDAVPESALVGNLKVTPIRGWNIVKKGNQAILSRNAGGATMTFGPSKPFVKTDKELIDFLGRDRVTRDVPSPDIVTYYSVKHDRERRKLTLSGIVICNDIATQVVAEYDARFQVAEEVDDIFESLREII